MNRNELVADISERAEITRNHAEIILKTVLDAITATIKKNGKMLVKDLGTFTATKRPERRGRNPQTGAEIVIPATIVPGFKPASVLKEILNEETEKT